MVTQIRKNQLNLDASSNQILLTDGNNGIKALESSEITNFLRGDGTWAEPFISGSDRTPFIIGTQTQVTNAFTGSAPTLNTLYDGMLIRYWIPYNSNGLVTLELTLSDGITTTTPVNVYYTGSTRLSDQYSNGSIINLTYRDKTKIADGTTEYTGWWCDANYYQDTNTDTKDQMQLNVDIKPGSDVPGIGFLMLSTDNKYHPVLTTTGNTATKTISTKEFLINAPILVNTSGSYTTGSNIYGHYLYTEINLDIGTIYFNTPTWQEYTYVYLKGTINVNNNFVLDNTTYTSYLTQTLPTTEDGFVYMLFGYISTNDKFKLILHHPVYEFKNGAINLYVTVSSIPIASDTTLGVIKIGSGLSIAEGVLSATGGGGGDNEVTLELLIALS